VAHVSIRIRLTDDPQHLTRRIDAENLDLRAQFPANKWRSIAPELRTL
jgi:hypothetical protein